MNINIYILHNGDGTADLLPVAFREGCKGALITRATVSNGEAAKMARFMEKEYRRNFGDRLEKVTRVNMREV